MMHGREKSDSAIVAGKPTNKAVPTAAEPAERRAGAKGNASQQSTDRAQNRERVSQARERVRRAARRAFSPSYTQGGSRMPELGTYGSGRGARGNSRPPRSRGKDRRNDANDPLAEVSEVKLGRLNVSLPYHLGPFFRLLKNQLSEIRR